MKDYHTPAGGYISKSQTIYQGEKELGRLEERIYGTFLNGNSGERQLLNDEYNEIKRRMDIVKSVESYDDAVEWEELYEKAYDDDLLGRFKTKTIPNKVISKSTLDELSEKIQNLKDKILDKKEVSANNPAFVRDSNGGWHHNHDY